MAYISLKDRALIEQIVELRAHLVKVGTSKGLNHPETIKCSQKLDLFLTSFRNIYWESPNYYSRLIVKVEYIRKQASSVS